MKKHLLILLVNILLLPNAFSQQNPYWAFPKKSEVHRLRKEIELSANDTTRMIVSRKLGIYYGNHKYDSAVYYFSLSQTLARKLDQPFWEAEALIEQSEILSAFGNFPNALRNLLDAQNIIESLTDDGTHIRLSELATNGDFLTVKKTLLFMNTNTKGIMHIIMGDPEEAKQYYYRALKLAEELDDTNFRCWAYINLGEVYNHSQNTDSAYYANKQARNTMTNSGFETKFKGFLMRNIGGTYLHQKKNDSSEFYYRKAVNTDIENESGFLGWDYLSLVGLFQATGQPDSILHYAKLARNKFSDQSILNGKMLAYGAIRTYYNNRNIDSAYFYSKLELSAKDSLTSIDKQRMLERMNMNAEINARELQKEISETKNRNRIITLSGLIVVIFIIALIFYRNNKQKQKANTILESTLSNLKATQSQLIQSEKMASLGELTAGIAHEIQNPLNFVNNFSEVSGELVDELNEEVDKGNSQEVKNIASDLKNNLEKINHHGKRADAIVKAMLHHSRTSSGQKELTDINALCDEYLRLSYHGLRAKDKNFNAKIETDFDTTLPKIEVVPQDIGRVVLNLINNAFYVVNERLRQAQPDSNYEPTVTISTKTVSSARGLPTGQAGGKGVVEIRVKDNGSGIPDHIKEKIFQPFFTTKPTGQGTGLGLSLSYDIVKAHGGELRVETLPVESVQTLKKVGDLTDGASTLAGSQFSIVLPVV